LLAAVHASLTVMSWPDIAGLVAVVIGGTLTA
jgi:hypothetical protein